MPYTSRTQARWSPWWSWMNWVSHVARRDVSPSRRQCYCVTQINKNRHKTVFFHANVQTEKIKKQKGVDDSQRLTPEFVLVCGSHTVTQWLINLGFEGMFYYKSLSVTVTTQEGQIMKVQCVCLRLFRLLKLNTRASNCSTCLLVWCIWGPVTWSNCFSVTTKCIRNGYRW